MRKRPDVSDKIIHRLIGGSCMIRGGYGYRCVCFPEARYPFKPLLALRFNV